MIDWLAFEGFEQKHATESARRQHGRGKEQLGDRVVVKYSCTWGQASIGEKRLEVKVVANVGGATMAIRKAAVF